MTIYREKLDKLKSYFFPDYGTSSENSATDEIREADYESLEEIPDGAGCTEIWEKLSGEREGVKQELEET